MTTIRNLIDAKRISFGRTSSEFGTNDLAAGGWVNVTVPVLLDGAPLGAAYVGGYIWTDSSGLSADHYDRINRSGFAVDSYEGDRNWKYQASNSPDLEDLADDEEDAEEALLDAAEAAHDIDYEDEYRDALIAQLPEWRNEPVILAVTTQLRHESAVQWYDSLGHHVSTDDGDVAHPVCGIDEVDTYEPQNKGEEQLLDYAKAAKDAAETIETALSEAVDSYRHNDLKAVVAALEEARATECEYGDDPAASGLADHLLNQADDESTYRIVEAVRELLR